MNKKSWLIVFVIVLVAVGIYSYNNGVGLDPSQEYVLCGQEKTYYIKGPIIGWGQGSTQKEAKEMCKKIAVLTSSPHSGCLWNNCDVEGGCVDDARNIGGDTTTYDCSINVDGWFCECKITGKKIKATISCTPCVKAVSK